MTRRSDLMLEDLTGCDHSPAIPVVDDFGNIDHWLCHCGRRAETKPEPVQEECEENNG